MNQKHRSINQLCKVRMGYSFRQAPDFVADGTSLVVQPKDVSDDGFLTIDKTEQRNRMLRNLMTDFSKIDLTEAGDDVIGNAYMYMIERFGSGAGKKAGKFFTAKSVATLLARLAKPQPGWRICDPACGSAGLLLLAGEEIENDTYKRFWRGIPPATKGDYAFVSHMVETAKAKEGKVAVIVPHGVLFRGASEGRIRKSLLQENIVDAVIGLPAGLFQTTSIPVAILILDRSREPGGMNDKRQDIFFIEANLKELATVDAKLAKLEVEMQKHLRELGIGNGIEL